MIAVAAQRSLGWWRTLSSGALLGAAAFMVVGMLALSGSEQLALDFRTQYFPGAEAVADGRPLYVTADDPALEAIEAYVYPPQLALALVPLTVVPEGVAVVVAFLASLAAVLGALAVVGVRDVRCYAAVLVSAPAWNVLEMSNVSAALVLGLALAWRFRATVWPVAIALGLSVSTKLFLWPLLVWLLGTRRVRSAALAVTVAVATTLLSWAAIGFQGLTGYPALLRRLSEIHAETSYSFAGLADVLGLGAGVGTVLTVVVGGALVIASFTLGREGDDRRAFTCAIAAALALSPIVWHHYVLLLLVPLAVARPRFSAVWLLPVALWLSPRAGHGGEVESFLPMLVVVIGLLYVSLARPRAAATPVEAA